MAIGKNASIKDKKKMYMWEGVNAEGKSLRGELSAENERLLKVQLRRQGVIAKKIKRKPKGKEGKAISAKDIAVFSRQMSTMMQAGVPLAQGLEIIGRGHSNERMRKMILEIKSDIEAGTSFSKCLAKHPQQFDELYVNLVDAGESGGVLETLLEKIATYKEKLEELKGKIKKAMFYPAAVIVVAFVVSSILLMFVVPQFEEMFQSFGADLPAFTRMVVNLSNAMQQWWYIIFGGIGICVYGFVKAKKTSKDFCRLLDRISLKVPVIGTLARKAAVARFARTLSTMFAAGVPLVQALESVSGATGNSVYGDAVKKMKEDVSGGTQLQVAMNSTGLFENMDIQMVAIGEESGALEKMLDKIATFYETEVDNLVDALSSLMEPFIMAVLGVVIGGLVIAMYLPIFKLGSVV